ncbi:MAG: hypothetical protein NZ601_06870 [candidate division WOR-3 bacterium]|nr:hypothetical protein [candidate division WOR-3 bacterium]MCX7757785.1 hypothetical protein [candidate division WOR-3 bacterium]
MKYKNFAWLIILVFSLSCFKRPRWQTNITIPLANNKKFKVIDLLDSSYFRINADSTIVFHYEGTWDSIFPIESLKINDRTDSTKILLRDFVIPNLDSTRITISISEITGLAIPESTIYAIIPSFNQTITKSIVFRNLAFLSLEKARIRITINNQTRLVFDTISCFFDGIELLSSVQVDSMTTSEHSIVLENFMLDSLQAFTVSISSRGTSDSIPISANDSLIFIMALESLKINAGSFRSLTPRYLTFCKQKIHQLQTNYSLYLTDLQFASGRLILNLQNNFPFSCSITFKLCEFNIDTTLWITNFETIEMMFPLRSYHNDSPNRTPMTLKYTILLPLDSNFVTISQEHHLKFSYQIQNITLEYLAATVLDTIHYTFFNDTISLNLPELTSHIYLKDIFLDIDFLNTLWTSFDLLIHVYAQNSQGETMVFDTCVFLNPGNLQYGTNNHFRFNFAQFFNFHPTVLNLNAQLLLIGETHLNLSRQSFVAGTYELNTPLVLQIIPDTLTFGPFDVTISEEIREKIINNIDSANFYSYFINHLPLSVFCKIILENSRSQKTFISLNIPSGLLNNSGVVYHPSEVNWHFPLSYNDVEILTDSLVRLSLEIYLPPSDTVKIMARDFFMLVNSYAVITTHYK